MNKTITISLLFFLLTGFISTAQAAESDSLLVYLDGVTINSSRENKAFEEQPISYSYISTQEIEEKNINNLHDLSGYVPNFFMPDYGSKITSSIYMRGIGSRIDQPAVGLYVDGIPMLNKSLFDFDFYEIRSIEVLRGPQGTLYGRNAMAGVMNVETVAPSIYDTHTNVSASYGNYNDLKLRAAHYNHIGKVAFSLSGYYNQNDGYFTNQYTGKKIDDVQSMGGRLSAKWVKNSFLLHYTGNYDYTKQGGYPYAMYDSISHKAQDISYNDDCGYRRNLFNNGLMLKWYLPGVEFSSATSYQYLDDRMNLDQDFSPRSVFTLSQMQQEHAITQEFITKSSQLNNNYQWLFGLFGFYKHLDVQAPVTFKEDGISSLIEDNANKVFSSNPMMSSMGMKLDITNDSFIVTDDFKSPTYGLAFFHQSVYDNLFVPGLSITAGIRFDYEKTTLDYNSYTDVDYKITPMLNTPRAVHTSLTGSEENDFFQIIPKLALKYDLDKNNNIYASVSKGYKAGGFNTQMFADIIQKEMESNIKKDAYDQIPGYGAMAAIKENLASVLLVENDYNIQDVIAYDPEYSWNYEIGAHLSFFDKKLLADIALFYIDCRDQQLTVFSTYGMGRMMTNAGQTESYGLESSLRAQPIKNLWLNASYGYTHATFKEYNDGEQDYAGNYVPYAPLNTVSAGGNYTFLLRNFFIDRIKIELQYIGTGKIYWTEKNDVSQDFYSTLNGSLSFEKGGFGISGWIKNALDEEYNVFYFTNLGNSFMQQGKPLQFGVAAKWNF